MVACKTWLAMRALPGITNSAPFQTKRPGGGRAIAMINMRGLERTWENSGRGLFGESAEAEARRRIVITAILKLPNGGAVLKTLSGATTNGIITVFWDLVDDHGRVLTNDSFDSIFRITLPDSGRSQSLNGP